MEKPCDGPSSATDRSKAARLRQPARAWEAPCEAGRPAREAQPGAPPAWRARRKSIAEAERRPAAAGPGQARGVQGLLLGTGPWWGDEMSRSRTAVRAAHPANVRPDCAFLHGEFYGVRIISEFLKPGRMWGGAQVCEFACVRAHARVRARGRGGTVSTLPEETREPLPDST